MLVASGFAARFSAVFAAVWLAGTLASLKPPRKTAPTHIPAGRCA